MKANEELFNENDRDFFDRNGFVVLKNVISPNVIDSTRLAYHRMLQKCVDKEYLHVRTYGNQAFDAILGIEDVFNPTIYEKEILDFAVESKVEKLSKKILNSPDICMVLDRLICTYGKSYNGIWHRDGKLSDHTEHVQFSIPLYPESGLYVIPGSHKMTDEEVGFDCQTNFESDEFIPGQTILECSPGDVVIFYSNILHRGTCKGYSPFERAQLHFRFCKKSNYSLHETYKIDWTERTQLLKEANDSWVEIFMNNMSKEGTSDLPVVNLDLSPKEKIYKKHAEILHYISKFAPSLTRNKYFDAKHIFG